jgi:hypothetical protein
MVEAPRIAQPILPPDTAITGSVKSSLGIFVGSRREQGKHPQTALFYFIRE